MRRSSMLFVSILSMLLPGIVSTTASFYSKTCPEQSQRWLRQLAFCNAFSQYYICLHDTESVDVKEDCQNHTDYAAPGERYVWTGGFRNIDCPLNRFQPYNLYRNESHECQFLKSSCCGEGQVLHSNGSHEEDISCRCDETKNYNYVKEPVGRADCIPSKDDCSCYLVPCPTYNNQSDPNCTILVGQTKQTYPTLSGITHQDHTSSVNDLPTTNRQKGRKQVVWMFILVILCTLLMGKLMIFFLCTIGLTHWKPSWFYETQNEQNNGNEEHHSTSTFTQWQTMEPNDTFYCNVTTSTSFNSSESGPVNTLCDGAELRILVKEVDCEINNSCRIQCHLSTRLDTEDPEWLFRRANEEDLSIPSVGSTKYRIQTKFLSFYKGIRKCRLTELTVNSVKPEDAGEYVCKLRIGNNKEISDVAILRVVVPVLPTPELSFPSEDVIGIATSTATIKCSINIQNCYLKSVEWFILRGTLTHCINTSNNDKYSGGNNEELSLTIKDVKPDDQGKYFCRVSIYNGIDIRTENIFLKVKFEKPYVIAQPSKYVVQEDESVDIVCSVVSQFSEIRKIQWMFQQDGSNLVTNITEMYQCGIEDNVASLSINSARMKHGGKYWCRVTNTEGTENSNDINLKVIQRKRKPLPIIIPDCQMIKLGLGLTNSISWIMVSETQLKHISVKMRESDDDVAVQIVNHMTNPNVTFVCVNVCSPGTYECRCKDEHGESNSTVLVELLDDYQANIDYVVAIDIGSMRSKFAISKFSDCSISDNIMPHSEPTCLLFRSRDVLFGEQANTERRSNSTNETFLENFISDLCRSEDKFKNVKLGEKQLISASDVFIQILKALRTSVMNDFEMRGQHFEQNKILTVLILPSHIVNAEREFILNCCSKVELHRSRLLIISDSTAIMTSTEDQELTQGSMHDDQAYVIIDFGGYTCKVSAVKHVGSDIEELARMSLLSAGGNLIDGKICDIIESIVGDRVIEELKENAQFTKQVQAIKTKINDKNDFYEVNMPIGLTNALCLKYKNKDFLECLNISEYNSNRGDKKMFLKESLLYIGHALVNDIVMEVSDTIIEHTETYIKNSNYERFNGLIFAGGCSNIDSIKERMVKAFSGLTVKSGDGAKRTLQGALKYCCIPNIIISRVTELTLLMRRQLEFKEGEKWDLSKNCDSGEFITILSKNSYIQEGKVMRVEFSTAFEKQARVDIKFFTSLNDEVKDAMKDNLKTVLSESVQLGNISSEPQIIDVYLDFRYDLIDIQVVERSSGIKRHYGIPLNRLSSF